jgi:hypothetical protein
MRRQLLTAALLLALPWPDAHAQYAHMAWDNCTAEGGSQLRTFACNTNTGSHTLVVSFEWPLPEASLLGIDLDLHVLGMEYICVHCPLYPLPSYWLPCRSSAISVVTDFTGPPFSTSAACIDIFQARAASGWTYIAPTVGDPGRARIRAVAGLLADQQATLTPGVEYYAYQIRFTNEKTVGEGACSGCCTAVTVALSTLRVIYQEGSGDPTSVNLFGTEYPRWQGSNSICVTSTTSQNWGRVKALYR